MPLKIESALACPAPSALEVPPAAGRRLQKRARRAVGAQREAVRRPLILKTQHELAVAVADDRIRRRLAVARLELAHRLADERAAHLAAANNRKHVVDAGQVEVGEVVEHKAHGNGQPAAFALGIGMGAEALECLAHKEARERRQALVHIVHGHEQSAAFVSQGAEVDLPRPAKRGQRPVKGKRKDIRRDYAHDARVHLLGMRRGARPAKERGGVAVGILPLEPGEHGGRIAVASPLEHAHHRGHVLLPCGICLEHVGYVARQVVGGGTRPKRVLPHVLAGKERACDGDDVLPERASAPPAHMAQRVVADRALHCREVEPIDLVAMFSQVGTNLTIEPTF